MMSFGKNGMTFVLVGLFLMIIFINFYLLSNQSIPRESKATEEIIKELKTLKGVMKENNGNDGATKELENIRQELEDLKDAIREKIQPSNDTKTLGVSVSFRTRPIRPWWRYDAPSLNQRSDRYLAFTPYLGGFNNDRMSLEIVFGLAYLLNRTLVLPPKYYVYLLGFSDLMDYFDAADIRSGVKTITWAEFAEVFPELPKDKIQNIENLTDVYVMNTTRHDGSDVWCFPKCPKESDNPNEFKRLNLFADGRKGRHDVDEIGDARVLYFAERTTLSHFYAMFFFTEEMRSMERYVKRLVRDHVHYPYWVLDVANRIIAQLPSYYTAFHIRRGDFQYKEVSQYEFDAIYNNSQNLLLPHEPIYIATDEKNETLRNFLFEPFIRNGHQVYHLGMFTAMLEEEKVRKMQ